jgi:hypothetical protein
MKARYNISLACLLLISWVCGAQEQYPYEWLTVAHDSSSDIQSRMVDTNSIYTLRTDNDFIYTAGPRSDETYWQRFKRWFFRQFIAPLFDGRAAGVMDVLYLILGMLGVGVLFYFLFKGRQYSALSKGDVTWGEVFTNPADIANEQFVTWMESAEASADYNEAIKYLYLWCIRQMDVKNFIHYRPEFTNRQVLNKLSNPEVKSVFHEVAKNFEFVWYGHFEINASDYNALKQTVHQSPLRP